uniref:POU domain protein n=1 Tax=Romanomermis culicivorax TaxID=13658 RepID=A0A915KZM5_ROMCU
MQTHQPSLYAPFPTSSAASGRYSPGQYARRHCIPNPGANFFGGIDEGFFSTRPDLMDIKGSMAPAAPNHILAPSYGHHFAAAHQSSAAFHAASAMDLHLADALSPAAHHHNAMSSMMAAEQHHMSMAAAGLGHQLVPYSHPSMGPQSLGAHHSSLASAAVAVAVVAKEQAFNSRLINNGNGGGVEPETDPRELEAFAEHFKQRRIKLGVTQSDVGKALANLKLPGVGSLSQSTICRFESLTLSHNNMIALKPILATWLDQAEAAIKSEESCVVLGHQVQEHIFSSALTPRLLFGPNSGIHVTPSMVSHKPKKNRTSNKDVPGSIGGILPNGDKKRKRTSIAAPEKRQLEQFFNAHPRPSGEKIAAIAEKLDLKKNVVRVWFCNQRQKQKRCRQPGRGENSFQRIMR